jgi:mycothiol synthase
MTLIVRPYAGVGDLHRITNLVLAFPSEHLHVVDRPYRLSSWALETPRNVCLWEDEAGQLVGFAMLQLPWHALDYAFLPSVRETSIEQDIIDWAHKRAAEIAQERQDTFELYVSIPEHNLAQRALFESLGFAPEEWFTIHMARPLDDPIPAPEVPAGYTIRPLAGASEVEGYVELHRAAFDTKNMTTEWRYRSLQAPEYIADIDLVAVAPDGQLAAFCICWFNQSLKQGQIEPLGVHPSAQQHGLGRAILHEALRRLQQTGAETALVDSYSVSDPARALYESAGFQPQYHALTYAKSFQHQP